MRRFWTMLCDYHGQTWKASELARAQGVSQPTVGRYLDALTDALVIRQLQPWFANVAKRQVRSPKVYIPGTGVLHRLLGIGDRDDLWSNPKVGASWEGFVVEQGSRLAWCDDPWFWRTQATTIRAATCRGGSRGSSTSAHNAVTRSTDNSMTPLRGSRPSPGTPLSFGGNKPNPRGRKILWHPLARTVAIARTFAFHRP